MDFCYKLLCIVVPGSFKTVTRSQTLFLSYLLSLTSFYLLIVGEAGYCCTWSHSMAHTHILGRSPLGERSRRLDNIN